MVQVLALGFTKLSFAFFYRLIFVTGTSSTAFSIATLVTIGVVTAWMTSFFFAYLLICGSHPSVYWESFEASTAHCFKTSVALDGFSISDFLTDVIVLLLPIPMVSSSNFRLVAILNRYSCLALGNEAPYDNKPQIRCPRRLWPRFCVNALRFCPAKISNQKQSNCGIDFKTGQFRDFR